MEFNRQNFIDETCGNLGVALDMIDGLVEVINGYILDDDLKKQILSVVKDRVGGEYLEDETHKEQVETDVYHDLNKVLDSREPDQDIADLILDAMINGKIRHIEIKY